MKTLEKSIEELLVFFLDLEPIVMDEVKRKQKVLKGLRRLTTMKLKKIRFQQDLSKSYLEIRRKISPEIWEDWVIRRIFYNFHMWQYCKSCTKHIYCDLLNYIKNVMPVSRCPDDYPLHRAVIENKLYEIRQLCMGEDCNYFYINIDQHDMIGNSPLMLAVKLKLYEAIQILIDHGADPKYRVNPSSPSPIEQAVAMEDKAILILLISGYHRELHAKWSEHIEEFAYTLEKIPDFSINMSWECISSFIPFLKKFTPSDEYSIYKQGKNLRIDLTLVGWEQLRAKRGKISLMFDGDWNKVILMDHDKNSSKELFNELSYTQIEKHAEVTII
jgi:GPCR-chaperone/Ankyrin repeat